MKKLCCVCFVAIFISCFFAGCAKKTSTWRMEQVTFYRNGESVSVSAEELKQQLPKDYVPNGSIYDNYFFVLKFSGTEEGQAIFVFSELGDEYKDTVADSFTIEEKSGNRIVLTFTNGQTLSGEKAHGKLILSANGVTYVFAKK